MASVAPTAIAAEFSSAVVASTQPILAKNPHFVDSCATTPDRPPRTPHECECTAYVRGRERSVAAKAALESNYDANPDDPWAAVALGAYWVDRPGNGAVEPLQQALEMFRRNGDETGEAYAQSLLVRFHYRNRNPEARFEALAELNELLSRVDDPVVQARAAYAASQTDLREFRLDSGLLRLRQAYAAPEFADLPPSLQRNMLRAGATMAIVLSRFSETLDLTRRARETCEESANCWDEELNMRARAARYMATARLIPKEEAAALTLQAYRRSKESGAGWVELQELCELGNYTDAPESLQWFAQCSERARELQCADISLFARLLNVAGAAREDPARRESAIREVRAIQDELRGLGMQVESIGALGHLATLYRLQGQYAEAADTMRRAISDSETHQDRQVHAQNRADALALSKPQVYSLARLLATHMEAAPQAIEEAFAVLERFRVRVSYVEANRAEIGADADGSEKSRDARRALDDARERVSNVQGQLRNAALADTDRADLLAQLVQLELQEQRALLSLSETDPALVQFERPQATTVRQLQSSLHADEVWVAYQLVATSQDKPWALVVGPDAIRAVDLPADMVEATLGLYLGMLARRDGSERAAADRLSAALVQPVLEAIAEMGKNSTRLIVVPDGRMFQLPLAALPIAPGEEPLVHRFEISHVSSATEWVELQASTSGVLRSRALGIAGSPLRHLEAWMMPDAAVYRAASVSDGPLRNASNEVRDVVRRFGGAGTALDGQRATEAAVRDALREPFGVLHIAAHAVSNHGRPSRSAVILASDGSADDGLLQPNEISRLDLKDTLVVLASCSSADGQRSGGGGPISLARSFAAAGSPAVIGTLWPVQDSESAQFAGEFYRRLAGGQSASGALIQAQRAMADAGYPAASWAAYVLIGTGGVGLEQPIVAATHPYSSAFLRVLAILVAICAAVVLFRRVQRRKQDSSEFLSSRR